MKNQNNKQVILLPKGAVTEGKDSRNPVLDLLTRAGYDKIKSGFDPKARNRNDQVTQGDFVFRAVKGAPALAAQFELFRAQNVGVIMGSDVLAEADQLARTYGVQADIKRLLTLGIGPCTLQLLVPEEQPIAEAEDVDGRVLFTKYPALLRSMLQSSGRNAAVRSTDGADTRVNEYREEMPGRRIGAMEIVGTGETARANKLQIVDGTAFPYPSGEAMGMPYLDLMNITTDLYMTRIGRVGARSRDMLRELGLALESARASNQYAAFTFNIPAEDVCRFADLGMKGPTVSDVASRDGRIWKALQVYVPIANKNSMRTLLLQRGAVDLSVGDALQVEVAPENSEVLSVLPFRDDAAETVEAPDRNDEIADWLMGLRDTVADRAANPKPGSSTTGALEKGAQFCVSRYVGEVAELSKAVRTANRAEVILEAGQAVYWLLVSLQARGMDFEQLVESMSAQPQPGALKDKLAAGIRSLRAAVKAGDLDGLNGTGYMLDQGVNSAAVSFTDQATELSTALNKKSDAVALEQALEALKGLICLSELAGVDFAEVMDKEMGK